jgi:4,5-DOPA dioxygenase extradiol
MTAIEQSGFTDALGNFGREFAQPRAVVVISAHWQEPRPLRVTGGIRAAILHDFGGFPPELYALDYPSPGDPAMARKIADLLGRDTVIEPARGLDHGAWVPLRLTWPAANIPALQVSLPFGSTPQELFELGRALRPLRERDVLLLGTGGVVHNLRRARLGDSSGQVDGWTAEFDTWVKEQLESGRTGELFAYRTLASNAGLAVPTTEHFDPLFCVLGEAFEGERVRWIYEGVEYGNLSMRSYLYRS